MALGKCPECSREISIQANSCPHCGKPRPFEIKNELHDSGLNYGCLAVSVGLILTVFSAIAQWQWLAPVIAVLIVGGIGWTLFVWLTGWGKRKV